MNRCVTVSTLSFSLTVISLNILLYLPLFVLKAIATTMGALYFNASCAAPRGVDAFLPKKSTKIPSLPVQPMLGLQEKLG